MSMEVAMPSRKPRKIAVRSTDLGQSGWWILPPTAGIIAGGVSTVSSQLLTHNTASSAIAGVVSATVTGLSAATPQFRDWFSARSHRRQIAESAGATIDISRDPLDSLRVHTSNRDITEFVPRDIQDQLIKHLNNGTPVLIEGPSMSGKTRLTIEVIRSQWPNRPHWFPPDEDSIEIILKNQLQPKRGAIIILDDLDRFLSNQSLKLGQLNRWISNSCIIIATMMHSQYVKHSDRSSEEVAGWDVINRFKRVTLSRSLSTTELKATQLTPYANQISQIESIGLGPLLGCAEAVRAAFADELRNHSWCGVLIKAAADWRRIGLGSASREQLITFSRDYSNAAWGPADWDDVWQQATKPINDTIALLRQVGNDSWEVLDIIADEANWTTPSSTLSTAATLVTKPSQLLSIATAMTITDNATEALQILNKVISLEPRNTRALGSYAILLKNQGGDPNEVHQTYESAIKIQSCESEIIMSYAIYLQQQNDRNLMKIKHLYERALSQSPNNPTYLASYALFLDGDLNDHTAAKDKFEASLKIDPDNATTLTSFAATLMKSKEEREAGRIEELYRHALEIEPENELTLIAYGQFLQLFHQDLQGARDRYRKALSINPNNEVAAKLLDKTSFQSHP
ncbi:tetratricopeptide repeat protein [Actinomyces oris]|uniref:tetratricopeptide repeat protein n=2 Tax=Actinomyces oris TaxID=544580 RepID=UPI0028E6CBB7|nr:tetratricopeptide repeat protein [Actinomyces oris]